MSRGVTVDNIKVIAYYASYMYVVLYICWTSCVDGQFIHEQLIASGDGGASRVSLHII